MTLMGVVEALCHMAATYRVARSTGSDFVYLIVAAPVSYVDGRREVGKVVFGGNLATNELTAELATDLADTIKRADVGRVQSAEDSMQ